MENKSKFIQGIDNDTFRGIGYLLWLNIKKQIFLWVLIIIILVSCILTSLSAITYYKSSSYQTLLSTKSTIKNAIIFGTLLPLLLICIFSIPSTLNSMHKSTLIKRIGSTRINEESFITIIFTWYFIIALISVTIFYFGLLIIVTAYGSGLHLMDGWFRTYLFSIFVVALMVSMGVLLGTLPVSQAVVTAIASLLFVVSILFGGFVLVLTNGINTLIPTIGKAILIVNPLGFSSFAMASLLTGTYGTLNTLLSLVYISSITLLFFFSSAILMNFTKIN